MTKLIQNAIQVKETGEYLISLHTHDYCKSATTAWAVDGGPSYRKMAFPTGANPETDCVDLYLLDTDSLTEKINKALIKYRGTWALVKDLTPCGLRWTIAHAPTQWLREVATALLTANGYKDGDTENRPDI